MPKIMGMEPKTAKTVGLVAAGVATLAAASAVASNYMKIPEDEIQPPPPGVYFQEGQSLDAEGYAVWADSRRRVGTVNRGSKHYPAQVIQAVRQESGVINLTLWDPKKQRVIETTTNSPELAAKLRKEERANRQAKAKAELAAEEASKSVKGASRRKSAGAAIGGGLGTGLSGAGLGFVAGGPIGAAIGGAAGFVVGALGGALAASDVDSAKGLVENLKANAAESEDAGDDIAAAQASGNAAGGIG